MHQLKLYWSNLIVLRMSRIDMFSYWFLNIWRFMLQKNIGIPSYQTHFTWFFWSKLINYLIISPLDYLWIINEKRNHHSQKLCILLFSVWIRQSFIYRLEPTEKKKANDQYPERTNSTVFSINSSYVRSNEFYKIKVVGTVTLESSHIFLFIIHSLISAEYIFDCSTSFHHIWRILFVVRRRCEIEY